MRTQFFHIFSKNSHPRKLYCSFFFFSPKKVALLSLLKEVKPSPDGKIIKPLTFDNLSDQYDILGKTSSRMTTATVFSGQNNTGSHVSTTEY